MNQIPASRVKELRERTGAGMMDCKRTLIRFGGDIEFAEKYMNASGCAVLVRNNREAWNMRRAIEQLGRPPFADANNER